MKLNKVTITGADDLVDPNDLVKIQEMYPFVEWGILFSSTKAGTPRYPKKDWISNICKLNINTSAHFCGYYSISILKLGDFSYFDIWDSFSRYQLNFNFGSGQYNLPHFLEGIKRLSDKSFIFQSNKSNNPHISFLGNSGFGENLHFLYDSSGGRGTEIKDIQAPFKNYTGHAGGINPDNAEKICQLIAARPEPDYCWIDMESGVRTNDCLDLEKVVKVLNICEKYVYG